MSKFLYVMDKALQAELSCTPTGFVLKLLRVLLVIHETCVVFSFLLTKTWLCYHI